VHSVAHRDEHEEQQVDLGTGAGCDSVGARHHVLTLHQKLTHIIGPFFRRLRDLRV
jgi:hypothetical protein